MSTKTQLVARGVDTLVLNFYYLDEHGKPLRQPIPEELKELLDAWKQAAIVASEYLWYVTERNRKNNGVRSVVPGLIRGCCLPTLREITIGLAPYVKRSSGF